MTLERLRAHCLALPAVTEQILWGDNLVFKVGGRMFAVAATEPSRYVLSFKCSREDYSTLVEQEGIDPAPYLARARWVALQGFDVLRDREILARVSASYELVVERLTRVQRRAVQAAARRRASRRS